MTDRIDSRLDDILTLTVSRLVAAVPNITADTCYLCLDPDQQPATNPGDRFITVSPMSGYFSDSMIDGGGVFQTTSEGGILVKIHSTIQEDEARHDAEFLTNAARGVIAMMRDVIAALTVWDANNGTNNLLRQPLFPTEYRFIRDDRSLGGVELVFQVMFDWAIS